MGVRKLFRDRLETLGRKEMSIRKLARLTKMDHTTIGDFLNGSELTFHKIIPISNVLFPHDPVTPVAEYALEVELFANRKAGLEFCSMNRKIDIGYQLLDKFKGMPAFHDAVLLYQLLFDWLSKKVTSQQVLEQIYGISVESEELTILRNLFAGYAYNDLRKFALCYEVSSGGEKQINNVTIPYFKYSLSTRYAELYGQLCLRAFCDKETSREYCQKLIDSNLVEMGYKASAYYILGTSYFFDNYDKTICYYQKCVETFAKSNRKQAADHLENYFIPLTHITYNRFHKVKTNDKSLLAYLHAKTENKQKALSYLEEFEKEKGLSPFSVFVRGLILKDGAMLVDAMARYDEMGEMFFINLPRFEAIRLGEPKEIVNAMVRYKQKSFKGVEDFEKVYNRNVSSLESYRIRKQPG